MALGLSKLFLRSISQNVNDNATGISLWTLQDVEAAQLKQKLALEAATAALAGTTGKDGDDDNMDIDDDAYGDGGITDTMLSNVPISVA